MICSYFVQIGMLVVLYGKISYNMKQVKRQAFTSNAYLSPLLEGLFCDNKGDLGNERFTPTIRY